MGYYQRHVFVCTNSREPGKDCCAADGGADDARGYLKDRVREQGMNGAGQVRVSGSGCLGRCSDGPVIVIYPEATWYTYVDREDLDEIVDRHLGSGEIVSRLLVDPD
ncbi:(2Fe-2S) ferredoxin domain-containing protein [Aquisalimonas sp.]|uniref:(2Fe-2S) ferredoxin domain-containing protein n=1 Tax=unclassified Aquisalimonas TaxID=2644645 RepID=UPI0025BEB844|nr:(2Fe-2S) ferredoxin domain-containing protein [Aquisalimonas sp.]